MERHALRDDPDSPGLSICYRVVPARSVATANLGNRLFVDAVIWKFRWEHRGAICRNVSAAGAIRQAFLPLGG